MTADTRIPYGLAKRIVATLEVGQPVIIRPQYQVAFHNAARRMGMRVQLRPFRRDGMLLYRLLRVAEVSCTAHAFRPRDAKGHFLAA